MFNWNKNIKNMVIKFKKLKKELKELQTSNEWNYFNLEVMQFFKGKKTRKFNIDDVLITLVRGSEAKIKENEFKITREELQQLLYDYGVFMYQKNNEGYVKITPELITQFIEQSIKKDILHNVKTEARSPYLRFDLEKELKEKENIQ